MPWFGSVRLSSVSLAGRSSWAQRASPHAPLLPIDTPLRALVAFILPPVGMWEQRLKLMLLSTIAAAKLPVMVAVQPLDLVDRMCTGRNSTTEAFVTTRNIRQAVAAVSVSRNLAHGLPIIFLACLDDRRILGDFLILKLRTASANAWRADPLLL